MDIDNLKKLWKRAFTNDPAGTSTLSKEQIFENMDGQLKSNLFGEDLDDQFQIFNAMLDDFDSAIYDFIKSD